MRNVTIDPRVGDVVQVWPVGYEPPKPLIVTDVNDQCIRWRRGDYFGSTPWDVWQRTGANAQGAGKTLELIDEGTP